jgi:hypothetical protein
MLYQSMTLLTPAIASSLIGWVKASSSILPWFFFSSVALCLSAGSALRNNLSYLFPRLIQRERLVEEIYASIQHAAMHHRICSCDLPPRGPMTPTRPRPAARPVHGPKLDISAMEI